MQNNLMRRRRASLSLASGICAATGAWWALQRVVRSRRRIDLTGRTALVTGGSRGLGLAIARELVRRGANIAICARDERELAAAEADLIKAGSQVLTIPCDLTQPAQIQSMISVVDTHFSGIDLLVKNARTIIVGPQAEMTMEDYERAMTVNFWAAVHASKAVEPIMKSQGGGRIVNVASVGGKMPVPHLLPYCASKFALVGFSAGLRTELATDGILVPTVNPGLMNTGSPRNALFKGKHQAEYAWFSISDAVPLVAMSATAAATQIVDAAIHGDAEVTLGLPAKIVATLYGIAPSTFIEAASLIARMLPGAPSPSRSSDTQRGSESESPLTRSPLRHRGHVAEKELLQ